MNSLSSHSNSQHQDILDHYTAEVSKNIATLQSLMLSMRDHDSLLMNRLAFTQALQSIRDLAMIHGFECVEAVAEKIESSLRGYDKETCEQPAQFIGRLGQAIEVLRQLAAMSDEHEAQHLLKKAEYVMDHAIDSIEPELETTAKEYPMAIAVSSDNAFPVEDDDPDDFVTSKSDEASNMDDDDYFDIREPDMPLLKADDENTYGRIPESVSVVDDFSLNSDVRDAVIIDGVMNDILIKKLTHELDRLSAAIERVYVSRDGIHGIQEIRDICSSLKNQSEQLGASLFNDIVFPLERVSMKCLQDEDESALVLQTIARAEESLRAYLLSPTENGYEMSALKAELETVLFLYEGQNEPHTISKKANGFVHDDNDLFTDSYNAADRQPVFMRLRRLFGMV